ncbi:24266_t:CDS:1, partial [Gigaspora rosea]
ILDTEAEEEPCGDLEKWSQPKPYDTKTVTNLSRSDNVSSEVSELERDNENDEVDASQIVEQGLMQELSQNTPGVEINESYIQKFDNLVPGSAQSLSYLFNKAVIKGQEEILCWYYYSLEFENKVKSLITDGNIKDKTARTKLYKEMKPFLPRVTDSNL